MPLRASLNTSHSLSPAHSRASACCKQLPVVYTRKPHIKIGYDMGREALFHVGRKSLNALDDAAALHFMHFRQLCLCALGCTSAQVALAAFCAHHFTRTRQAETLGSCLMGLQFSFASFCFARHC